MELYKLTTPKDDAWKVIESLGQEDLVQFLDMNMGMDVTKLIYQDRIKLCEETERRIIFLLNTCKEHFIKVNKPSAESFSRNISSIENEKKKSHDLLFDAIEQDVRDCENFVVTQRDTIDEIKTNIRKLEDYHNVVHFISSMMHNLGGAKPAQGRKDIENGGQTEPLMENSSLQFIAGTVKMSEMDQMQRLLFRNTFGKALTHFKPFMQDDVEKCAYLVVFSGLGGNRDKV